MSMELWTPVDCSLCVELIVKWFAISKWSEYLVYTSILVFEKAHFTFAG